ncbi:hypothetical protein WEI85_18955 [Actinomycetes bacterium KLBMP 9797]
MDASALLAQARDRTMTTVDAVRGAAGTVAGVVPFDAISRALAEMDRAAEERHRPDDPARAVSAELIALGANLAGAGLAAAGSVTRLARLPASVPAMVTLAANVPQLRAAARARIGPSWAEPLVAAGESAVAALAGQPTGLLVDAVHRVQRLTEARARQRVWERRADALFEDGDPEVLSPRPRPWPRRSSIRCRGRRRHRGNTPGSTSARRCRRSPRGAWGWTAVHHGVVNVAFERDARELPGHPRSYSGWRGPGPPPTVGGGEVVPRR